MKIAVTYENGQVFQHFGHTEQFKLYEVEDGRVVSSQVVDTNGSGHGALAGFLREYGVDALICGGIGGGAQAALAAAGIRLYGVSAYRSYSRQYTIYATNLITRGVNHTNRYSAAPGASEHQTGLAIDLALNREPIDFIRPSFPGDGICSLFREKMISYGFIERYPEGKEDITGIAAEPWHFRYVGVTAAKEIMEKGITLEEYLDRIDYSVE